MWVCLVQITKFTELQNRGGGESPTTQIAEASHRVSDSESLRNPSICISNKPPTVST